MRTPSFPTRAASSRSAVQVACAIGAALVGLVLLLYYVVPNLLPGSSSPIMLAASSSPVVELLVLVAAVGLLSIVGAIGYWMEKTWGWYVHLASVLGQLLFPGTLFEFKLDLHHMIGWTSPVISLVILIVMGIWIRRKRLS
jgi:hypothetical protein